MRERYHLVDAQGVGVLVPARGRPDRLAPTSPGITQARSYGYEQGIRPDDRLGTIENITLTWREEEQATEALLEVRLRMWQAAARAAVWLTRAGRGALPINGGFITATPLEGEDGSNFALVTLTVASARTSAVGTDLQAVFF